MFDLVSIRIKITDIPTREKTSSLTAFANILDYCVYIYFVYQQKTI